MTQIFPTWLHQRAVMESAYRLRYHCPPHLEVLPAPFRVMLDERTEAHPDLVVVRRTDYAPEGLRGVPLLAVEVCVDGPPDPAQRAVFERAGTPSYWSVEATDCPERARVDIWALGPDGRYRRVVRVVGEYTYFAATPYRVPVCPADLVP